VRKPGVVSYARVYVEVRGMPARGTVDTNAPSPLPTAAACGSLKTTLGTAS
jgi:hypothetical protein